MSGEERVSQLVGDRLCARCSYNLTGQPVLREPHYEMLIVRCPECAAVASVQEYPLLGKWAARWGMALAASWFVLLVALLCATGGVITGAAFASRESVAQPFAQFIAETQKADLTAQQPPAQPPAPGTAPVQTRIVIVNQPAQPWSPLDLTWAQQQDFGAMLAGLGGWTAVADVSELRLVWTPFALGLFAAGCVWAVALAHVRRKWLPLVALLPVAVAAIFTTIGLVAGSGPRLVFNWTPALHVARHELGPPVTIITVAAAYLPLAAGMLVGRPIVRGLVRALLPPRLRGSLAILWLVDGKQPPPSAPAR